jgi:hypothetical protein
VAGVEISPEIAINVNRTVAMNGWSNTHVIVADATSVKLESKFDALLAFAAADIDASSFALANLFAYLKDDARVVAFGARLSEGCSGKVGVESLWKLFAFTPAVALKDRSGECHVQETFLCLHIPFWEQNRSRSNARALDCGLPVEELEDSFSSAHRHAFAACGIEWNAQRRILGP